MDMEKTGFDAWAIVEVMGHVRVAGRVTEQAIGGASFVRIDVPAFDGQPAFTRLYGAAAIYSITPCTEELARKAARYCHAEPVTVYIPPNRSIPETTSVTREVRESHECAGCNSPCYCGMEDGECSLCGKCDPDEVHGDPGEGEL